MPPQEGAKSSPFSCRRSHPGSRSGWAPMQNSLAVRDFGYSRGVEQPLPLEPAQCGHHSPASSGPASGSPGGPWRVKALESAQKG